VLRSVLAAREPHLFKPGTFEAVAALIGCVLFVSLTRSDCVAQTTAAWITIAAVFIIRIASITFGVETKALRDFEEEWKERLEKRD
jgi:uncharacterized membrane protein YeiH